MQELNVLPEVLARFLTQTHVVVLIALLMAAAVIDWRTYRIPNWLTVGGMAFGAAYNTAFPPAGQYGILFALAGLGCGLIVFLPLYALRIMGAGDVKLMAMVGAFVGLPGIFSAVLYTLIVGGAAALGMAIYRRAFRRMASNVIDITQSLMIAAIAGYRPPSAMEGRASIGKLPYGISIAVGTIAWLGARQLGYA
jgi:prepilin peptidase CpaA